MRPDVTGGADHQLASAGIQRDRLRGEGVSAQPGNVAHPRPVDHLVLRVGGVGFVQHLARDHLGRHRVVEIDYCAPDFGVLEGDGAAQAPQHAMAGVRGIAFGDRLGVAGGDEQLGR